MLLDADSGLMFDARNTARSGSAFSSDHRSRKVRYWPTGMAAPLQQPQPFAPPWPRISIAPPWKC
jgi:hypothetical protein